MGPRIDRLMHTLGLKMFMHSSLKRLLALIALILIWSNDIARAAQCSGSEWIQGRILAERDSGGKVSFNFVRRLDLYGERSCKEGENPVRHGCGEVAKRMPMANPGVLAVSTRALPLIDPENTGSEPQWHRIEVVRAVDSWPNGTLRAWRQFSRSMRDAASEVETRICLSVAKTAHDAINCQLNLYFQWDEDYPFPDSYRLSVEATLHGPARRRFVLHRVPYPRYDAPLVIWRPQEWYDG
jgi:hypothetical protein